MSEQQVEQAPQQALTEDQGADAVLAMMFGGGQQAQQPAQTQSPVAPEKTAEAEAEEQEFFEFPAETEGGEARRVPVDEVIAGYRERDQVKSQFDQFRQEIVQRQLLPEDVETVMREAMAQRSALEDAIGLYRHALAPQPPSEDLINPAHDAYDPQAYYAQVQSYKQGRAALQKAERQLEAQKTQGSREQQALEASRKVREQQSLVKAWPDVIKPEIQRQALEFAKSVGFTEQEISGITDHRQWLVIKDAMAFRGLRDQQEAARKVVTAKPKLVRGNASQSQTRASNGQYAGVAQSFIASGGGDELSAADVYLAQINRK